MDVKYVIGVDTYDKDSRAYCVCKLEEGYLEVVTCRTVRQDDKFWEEVWLMADKYGADIFGEDGKIKRRKDEKN